MTLETGFGTVMRVGYALQLYPAWCLQGEVRNGSTRKQVDLDVRSLPSMWVDQHRKDACLHFLCTRGNICILLRQKEAL